MFPPPGAAPCPGFAAVRRHRGVAAAVADRGAGRRPKPRKIGTVAVLRFHGEEVGAALAGLGGYQH